MPLRLVGRCDMGRESERHDAEIRRERERAFAVERFVDLRDHSSVENHVLQMFKSHSQSAGILR